MEFYQSIYYRRIYSTALPSKYGTESLDREFSRSPHEFSTKKISNDVLQGIALPCSASVQNMLLHQILLMSLWLANVVAQSKPLVPIALHG